MPQRALASERGGSPSPSSVTISPIPLPGEFGRAKLHQNTNQHETQRVPLSHVHTHTVEQGKVHVAGRTQQSCTSCCPFLYSRLKHTEEHSSVVAVGLPAPCLPHSRWAVCGAQRWSPTLSSCHSSGSLEEQISHSFPFKGVFRFNSLDRIEKKKERKKKKKGMCLYTISHAAAAARQRYAVLQHRLRSTKTTGVDGHSDVSPS